MELSRMFDGTNREHILKAMGGQDMVDNINLGCCPLCSVVIKENEFKDALSLREFHISGMCQKCQDKTFRKEEDDEE